MKFSVNSRYDDFCDFRKNGGFRGNTPPNENVLLENIVWQKYNWVLYIWLNLLKITDYEIALLENGVCQKCYWVLHFWLNIGNFKERNLQNMIFLKNSLRLKFFDFRKNESWRKFAILWEMKIFRICPAGRNCRFWEFTSRKCYWV